MVKLTENQIKGIKDHMHHEEDVLKSDFKTRNTKFDKGKIPFAKREKYESEGWSVDNEMKTKLVVSRPKETGRQFEDDIWCMFYKLGFRILNADEELVIPWGANEEDKKQIDVVAVGDDAIFVVECKAAEKPKYKSFQSELIEMAAYKEGVTKALQQIYGEKRVKFIFATRKYQIEKDGEDYNRMKNNDIYHLDDNAYYYISKLIESYQTTSIYQFYGLMFREQLISDKDIVIPALRGQMGEREYFLFSIEPCTLLKIGFVLHRTVVNDSTTPTYQRLLIPKRLKEIKTFIDDEGGFFPNSIILNFAQTTEGISISFDPIHKEEASNAEFGLLHIPNAYAIAYIIDGQHRVYGYANTSKKNEHTIPVVAFKDMSYEDQLKIFMDINEHQQNVSKNLRIDLEQDLFWDSPLLDSRMKALRSAVIKAIASQPGTILCGEISVGQDPGRLSSVNFENAFSKSDDFIPKASKTKWTSDTKKCFYDVNETDIDKAMNDAKDKISHFVLDCYGIANNAMNDETKEIFLLSNRATFAFVFLMGHLHSYMISCNKFQQSSSRKDKKEKMTPYIQALAEGLNNLPNDDVSYLRGVQGQGAEKKWLLYYQSIINKFDSQYCPNELIQWRETRDQNLQEEGENLKVEIKKLVRNAVFSRLELVYGDKWQNNVARLRLDCEKKIYESFEDAPDFNFEDYDWKDWVELSEFRKVIEDNFSHKEFEETFSININPSLPFKSKKEKLAWMALAEIQKGKKKVPLTKSEVNRLEQIRQQLSQFETEE